MLLAEGRSATCYGDKDDKGRWFYAAVAISQNLSQRSHKGHQTITSL